MKAISLWQPWATAMALGSKRVETRSWNTSVRGLVAIHAAKRYVQSEMIYCGACWNWRGALNLGLDSGFGAIHRLPLGAIVAVGNLVETKPTGEFKQSELDAIRCPEFDPYPSLIYAWSERQMGDFSLGRFGWVFTDIRPLKTPLPWKGSQGFFQVPDSAILPLLAT